MDSRTQNVEKLNDLLGDMKTAMLTVSHDDGSLRSCPMMLRKREGDFLWFFTNLHGRKTDAMVKTPSVNISFSDERRHTYISVSAEAEVVKDRAKIQELWSKFDKAWFADGEDDEELALIKARMTGAEYWDSSAGFMVMLFGYARAVMTGKDFADTGHVPLAENEKISGYDLRRAGD